EDELQAFFKVMSRREGLPRWFMAPGNHDGYFYGNSYENPAGSTWKAACDRSKPLTKTDFLAAYLDAISKENDPGAKQLAARHAELAADEKSPELIATPAPDEMLVGAAWTLSKTSPWRSYLVQRLDLTRQVYAKENAGRDVPGTRVIAILLDTTTFEHEP